jgi:hypothetical protein
VIVGEGKEALDPMKNICAGILVLTLISAAGAEGAVIFDSPTGLPNPAEIITFDEVVLADGTALTNQFAGFGVTFSGLSYSTNPLTLGDLAPPVARLAGGGPVSLFFTTPQTDVALAFISSPANTMITALLNGVVVDTFAEPTNAADANIYYGFTGISPFNEVRIQLLGPDPSASIDNIQFGTATSIDPTPVPEPTTMSLIGLGLAGIYARRRRVRNAVSVR